MPFSSRVKHLLRIHGLSQSELARRIGVRQQTLCTWISRDTPPTKVTHLAAMARHLGVSMDDLLYGEHSGHLWTHDATRRLG